MNSFQFNSFSHQEKILFLQNEGVHLTTRTTDYYYIKLYSVNGYYIEVWTYSHLPWEGIVKIKLLHNTSMLKPYLSKEFFEKISIG
ncbi:MAG: hypothetical protein ACLFUB_19215 [Cyclobacteriaceae bacterium]